MSGPPGRLSRLSTDPGRGKPEAAVIAALRRSASGSASPEVPDRSPDHPVARAAKAAAADFCAALQFAAAIRIPGGHAQKDSSCPGLTGRARGSKNSLSSVVGRGSRKRAPKIIAARDDFRRRVILVLDELHTVAAVCDRRRANRLWFTALTERRYRKSVRFSGYAAAGSPSTVTTTVRWRGLMSHSRWKICCQVPSVNRPSRIRTVNDGARRVAW